VLAAHDGSLAESAAKPDGGFPFKSKHQDAWLRRPRPIVVTDPLPREHGTSELTDRLFKLSLACIVLGLPRRGRARIERSDVRPRRATCRMEECIQRRTRLAHLNDEPTLLRVSAEAGPSIGSEKRVVGHLFGKDSGATPDPGTGLDGKNPYPHINRIGIQRGAEGSGPTMRPATWWNAAKVPTPAR
jgi:hypothetical protein